jgi:signal transduction histidine kinase
LVPLAFLVGLLRMHLARAAVGELVIELGESPPPARLRDALARTLGDPSLRLAFWLPEANGYVTPDGQPFQLPAAGSGQMVTLVEQLERPLAALVHDPALADDPRLVDAVRAAARLELERERLHAELRTHLDELWASRRRIVEAADTERRRIERNLHDGAQQRLISVSFTLGLALAQLRGGPDRSADVSATITGAMAELRRGLDELRDLAHGIHPAILAQQGLREAVASLAEAAPLPVAVRIPADRYRPMVESVAYYVACEGLANAVRHARASRVQVTAHARAGWLVLEVTDDGAGNATTARNTGLRGLADRVAAVGGRFEVRSPAGAGTRLRAQLPLEAGPGPTAAPGAPMGDDGATPGE